MKVSKFGWLFVLILGICAFNAFGWSSDDPTDEHLDITNWLLNHTDVMPYLKPYVLRLNEAGISTSTVINVANSESNPDDGQHWTWKKIDSEDDIDGDVPLNGNSLGAIFHASEDSGVPAKHTPGGDLFENEAAHDYIEGQAHSLGYYSPPTGPILIPDDMLFGSYADKMAWYKIDSEYIATYYKAVWEAGQKETYKYAILNSSMLQALKMSVAAASQFLDAYEVAAPSYVMADWQFREGSGQIACSNKGSIMVPMKLGSSTGSDSYEPTWESWGWDGTALRFKKYGNHNNKANYLCNAITWTSYENGMLSPSGDYAIEALVKPDSIPTSIGSSNPNDELCILHFFGNGSPAFGDYSLKIYRAVYGDYYPTVVCFTVEKSDGTVEEFEYDTQEDGLTITAGHWYCVTVLYDESEEHLKLGIRDMISQQQEWSSNFDCEPMMGLSTPTICYIGTESTSSTSAHCFDGLIARVRISSTIPTNAQKIYNMAYDLGSNTVACWHMDFAPNINGYNLVIDDDRYSSRNNDLILNGGWSLETGYGRKRLYLNGTNAYGYGVYNWSGGTSAAFELSFRPENTVNENADLIHVKDVWGLKHEGHSLTLYMYDQNGQYRSITADTELENSTNYHVYGGIYANKTMELILNGEQKTLTVPTLMKNTSSKRITIGARYTGSSYNSFFYGYIDEVRIVK